MVQCGFHTAMRGEAFARIHRVCYDETEVAHADKNTDPCCAVGKGIAVFVVYVSDVGDTVAQG